MSMFDASNLALIKVKSRDPQDAPDPTKRVIKSRFGASSSLNTCGVFALKSILGSLFNQPTIPRHAQPHFDPLAETLR